MKALENGQLRPHTLIEGAGGLRVRRRLACIRAHILVEKPEFLFAKGESCSPAQIAGVLGSFIDGLLRGLNQPSALLLAFVPALRLFCVREDSLTALVGHGLFLPATLFLNKGSRNNPVAS